MRTRPAAIATIAIAIGLALTAIGIARRLPYTFGGTGDASRLVADAWAHGTAISPALVALAFLGLLAAIAMRPTRGGRRAALWMVVVGIAVILSGLAEPAQQQAILLGTIDEVTAFVWALHVSLIALVLSAWGETRRTGDVMPVSRADVPASSARPVASKAIAVPA
ncbi:MAG TPA: hypothetical protein VH440_05405 [Candidatus Limnocylindrales bacterium]|jgi:hypothetical protein